VEIIVMIPSCRGDARLPKRGEFVLNVVRQRNGGKDAHRISYFSAVFFWKPSDTELMQ
jgi:hypothetical protein